MASVIIVQSVSLWWTGLGPLTPCVISVNTLLNRTKDLQIKLSLSTSR